MRHDVGNYKRKQKEEEDGEGRWEVKDRSSRMQYHDGRKVHGSMITVGCFDENIAARDRGAYWRV